MARKNAGKPWLRQYPRRTDGYREGNSDMQNVQAQVHAAKRALDDLEYMSTNYPMDKVEMFNELQAVMSNVQEAMELLIDDCRRIDARFEKWRFVKENVESFSEPAEWLEESEEE